MASQRIFFGTQQCNPVTLGAIDYSLQSLFKRFGSGNPVVLNSTFAITTWITRSRTEFFSQKHVSNARVLQRSPKWLTIELWLHTAVGLRTHIRNGGYPITLQQVRQNGQRMCRMSNGEY